VLVKDFDAQRDESSAFTFRALSANCSGDHETGAAPQGVDKPEEEPLA
jgi:hypothetical protein